ncbi:hypothetical protein HRbin22_00887 [Candidatus Thermoflexus japonica]|uniref:DUF2079 domain-containing protein n=1 Tax=Candidatus Thermoflexus japonica TaxID=2035417 RepID=A0A2H5Y5C3_9CHLR|nr:hypothetical protein HRbin22_00887 [Candidatus Thermoflexus japonica]
MIVNRFSPELHPPALQYLLYVLLGHVARWLQAPPEALYGMAMGLGVLLLWRSLNRFFTRVLTAPALRSLALALVFSTGPAWILPLGLSLLRRPSPWGTAALDAATRIEHNTFLALMAPPHLTLALAVLLEALLALSEPIARAPRRWMIRTILALSALAFLNPFSLPTFLMLLGLRTFLGLWESRPVALLGGIQALVLGLLSVPLVAYQVATFQRDPFWGVTYGLQNLQPAYPLPLTLAALGLLGILGLAGAVRVWIPGVEASGFRDRFLSMAAIGLLAIAFLPFPYARRFAYGLGPVLAARAAPIAARLLAHPSWKVWGSTPWRRVIRGVTIGILLYSQNAFLYAVYTLSFLGSGPFPRAVFEPIAAFEAAAWLRAQGPGVVVLACEDDGNFLAGHIEGRVVLGHPGATFEVARKREEVAAFFGGLLSPTEQAALLQRYRVTHLYEREDRPCYRKRPAGTPVFQRPPVFVFRAEGVP